MIFALQQEDTNKDIKQQVASLQASKDGHREQKSPFIFSIPEIPKNLTTVSKHAKIMSFSDPFITEDFQTTPLLYYDSKKSQFERTTNPHIKKHHNLLNEKGDASTYIAFQEGLNENSNKFSTSTPMSAHIHTGSYKSYQKPYPQVSPIPCEANIDRHEDEFHFKPCLVKGKVPENKEKENITETEVHYTKNSSRTFSTRFANREKLLQSGRSETCIERKLNRNTLSKEKIDNADMDSGNFLVSKYYGNIPNTTVTSASIQSCGEISGTCRNDSFSAVKTSPQKGFSSLSRYKQRINTLDKEPVETKVGTDGSHIDAHLTKPSLSDLEDGFQYTPSRDWQHTSVDILRKQFHGAGNSSSEQKRPSPAADTQVEKRIQLSGGLG